MNDTPDCNRLVEILREKLQLMTAYRTLAASQVQLIEQSKLEELAKVLERKQQVITGIDVLDRERDALELGSTSRGNSLQQELEKLIRDIEQTALQAQEFETGQVERLEILQQGLRAKIQDLRAERRRVAAYDLDVKQNDGVFLDRKS